MRRWRRWRARRRTDQEATEAWDGGDRIGSIDVAVVVVVVVADPRASQVRSDRSAAKTIRCDPSLVRSKASQHLQRTERWPPPPHTCLSTSALGISTPLLTYVFLIPPAIAAVAGDTDACVQRCIESATLISARHYHHSHQCTAT